MSIFNEHSVAKSRKCRRCDWCSEAIEIGQPYESFRFRHDCGVGVMVMHPECRTASREVARRERGWMEWGPGFWRGSTSGR